MKARSFGNPSLVVLGIALVSGVVLGACRDAVAPDGGPGAGDAASARVAVESIRVIPAGPLELLPGDSVRIRAEGEDLTGTPRFESSDGTVASVSPRGLIEALRPGNATVTVTVGTEPPLLGSVIIHVGSRGASIAQLDSLTDGSGVRITTESLAGSFRAHASIQRGDAVRAEVVLDGVTGCSLDLPATDPGASFTAPELVSCLVDTRRLDPTAGTPVFRNGPLALSLHLLSASGEVLSRAPELHGDLANRDTLIVEVVPRGVAPDATGRSWFGGWLLLRALPVYFGREQSLDRAEFRFRLRDGQLFEAVAHGPAFSVQIPASDLAGRYEDSLVVTARGRLSDGGEGPHGASQPVAYDAVQPAEGSLLRRAWVGADLAFASLFIPGNPPDQGVGGVTTRFFVGDRSLDGSEIFQTGVPVELGTELRESGEGAYKLVYVVCDALENCVTATGFTFGVDHTPPVLTAVGIPDRVANPTGDLRVDIADARSGVDERPLSVSVVGFTPDDPAGVCGPAAGERVLPGRTVEWGCEPERSGTVLPIPTEEEGYYTYRITGLDRAGNRSREVVRRILVDHTPPRISQILVPAQPVPGEEMVIGIGASDNVDLDLADARLVYRAPDGLIALPFTGPTRLGAPFTESLSRTAAAAITLPFVRSLTTVTPILRNTAAVDSLRVEVTDAAGHRDTAGRPLTASVIRDPFPMVSAITASAASQVVCTSGCTPSDPVNLSLTIRVSGGSSMSAFARMFFYLRDDAGRITLLGSTSTFSTVATGTQRTYTYAFTQPPPTGLTGRRYLFGVALGANGNAIRSLEAPVEFQAR